MKDLAEILDEHKIRMWLETVWGKGYRTFIGESKIAHLYNRFKLFTPFGMN